ncbi:hypothetical protein [Crenobacter intestini]|uniref:Uncharacterized protein n=1 Tax=Crenobacter intestini TaxID=2563443 RepID=A0A4T0V110_9NEIS|nr:hypothetical protein [Crenobacter intestini]TIC85220.1 hypothetical protein E5K04_04265 [Crenobacter intestini]
MSAILTTHEAVYLLSCEFEKHGIELSAEDLLDDSIRASTAMERKIPAVPYALKGMRRYFRRTDVEALAAAIVATRKGKPKRKRPDPSKLIFMFHPSKAELKSLFEPLTV